MNKIQSYENRRTYAFMVNDLRNDSDFTGRDTGFEENN